ncbi:MAG: universal stress protein [Halobacteriaceae archaeon]
MYDLILVPTDGSAGAEVAARHAITLAAAFDSEVRLLSVVDDRSVSPDPEATDPDISVVHTGFEERAQAAVDSLAELVADTGVPYETAVLTGAPAATIREYAADAGVDLISMGTHGRTGLDRLLLGSVTERVVRTSDVPVLTSRVEPEDSAGYDRVLVPTDGSEAATVAIEHGVAIAERFDATVHALTVINVAGLAGAADVGPVLPDVVEAFEDQAEAAVEAVATRCEDRGVDVVTEISQGTPYRSIRSYVTDRDIDFVAMGTHGRTGLDRYLIGSVTERTVRTSEVPVLTVR